MPHTIRKSQVLLCVVAIGSMLLAARTYLNSRPVDYGRKVDQLHQDIGARLATLVRQTQGERPDVLLVLPDESKVDAARARWLREQVRGFEQQAGDIHIEGRETVATVISRARADTVRPARFTLALYRDLCKRHPDANVVVSFVGEPDPAGESADPRNELPSMVCFSPTGEHVQELMSQGLIRAAIVPRATSPPETKSIRADWFDVMYEVVTPESIGAWKAAFGTN